MSLMNVYHVKFASVNSKLMVFNHLKFLFEPQCNCFDSSRALSTLFSELLLENRNNSTLYAFLRYVPKAKLKVKVISKDLLCFIQKSK